MRARLIFHLLSLFFHCSFSFCFFHSNVLPWVIDLIYTLFNSYLNFKWLHCFNVLTWRRFFSSNIKQIWQNIHTSIRPRHNTRPTWVRARERERREEKKNWTETPVIPRRQSLILFVNAFMRRIHNWVHQISVFELKHLQLSVSLLNCLNEKKSMSLLMWESCINSITYRTRLSNEMKAHSNKYGPSKDETDEAHTISPKHYCLLLKSRFNKIDMMNLHILHSIGIGEPNFSEMYTNFVKQDIDIHSMVADRYMLERLNLMLVECARLLYSFFSRLQHTKLCAVSPSLGLYAFPLIFYARIFCRIWNWPNRERSWREK